jgi:ATP-dependent Lon protease
MDVFLFPLVNVTLFPRTTKPLNIFEPRYLAMVKESIQTQTPVAIGFVEDPSKVSTVEVGEGVPIVRQIAGFGIPQIIEERLNGTLLVFLKGKGKVKLGNVTRNDGAYIVCDAEVVVETSDVRPDKVSSLQALFKILTRWIHTHIPDPAQRDVFMKNVLHPEEIVGSFASYMVRDYDLQQMVLEFDDINDKIEFLFRLMESSEVSG